MKNEAKKSRLLTAALVILLAAALTVVIISILYKPTVVTVDPAEEDLPDTFGIDEEGRYLFPADIYTLLTGPEVTLTHRTAGDYEIWDGTDPDGEKIMLVYAKGGMGEYQYIRGSTQAGTGDFLGFDVWSETGTPIIRLFDTWCDGLIALPCSVSEDGETMTLAVPAVWRSDYIRWQTADTD